MAEVPALRRSIAILRHLASSNRPITAGALVRALEIPRSSAYELLTVLEELGLVVRTESGYVLVPACTNWKFLPAHEPAAAPGSAHRAAAGRGDLGNGTAGRDPRLGNRVRAQGAVVEVGRGHHRHRSAHAQLPDGDRAGDTRASAQARGAGDVPIRVRIRHPHRPGPDHGQGARTQSWPRTGGPDGRSNTARSPPGSQPSQPPSTTFSPARSQQSASSLAGDVLTEDTDTEPLVNKVLAAAAEVTAKLR